MKLDSEGGNAAAIDWKLTVTTPRGSRIVPRDVWEPNGVPGWSDREGVDDWTMTWMATGADDSIGAGLHREMLKMPANGGPQTVEGSYALRAKGMDERSGRLRVTIGDDPERPQTVEVF